MSNIVKEGECVILSILAISPLSAARSMESVLCKYSFTVGTTSVRSTTVLISVWYSIPVHYGINFNSGLLRYEQFILAIQVHIIASTGKEFFSQTDQVHTVSNE